MNLYEYKTVSIFVGIKDRIKPYSASLWDEWWKAEKKRQNNIKSNRQTILDKLVEHWQNC